jgi:ABC-type multidrug transport system fused ATPase/permease subunit
LGVALADLLSVALLVPFVESLRGDAPSSLLSGTPIAFVDQYFDGMGTGAKIRAVALALFVSQLAKSILSYSGRRMVLRLDIKTQRYLRMSVFDDLLSAGLGYIHREKIANLFTILNQYTGHTVTVLQLVVKSVPSAITAVLYIAVLLTISWPLTVIAIVMAGLTTFSLGGLSVRMKRYGARRNQASVRLNHIGFESLSAMRLIRLFARERYTRDRFEDGLRDLQRQLYDMGKADALVGPLYQLTTVSALAIILVVATFVLQTESRVLVEVILIFMVILFRLAGPMNGLNHTRLQMAGNIPAVHALIEFLERRDKERLTDGDRIFNRLEEGIRVESVSFRYASKGVDVLSDLSFEIPRGKTTAIVGASGSGKSTLTSLLSRLYDPTQGRILVDGHDLRQFKQRTWRSQVGVVSQDTFMFNDTVEYNIRFGKLDATPEEIREAARPANADVFIEEMPDGYETVLGDRGVRLSGGQAQRVSIARAILADPELLVLDEATSSLDTESERLVQEAIDLLSKDRTVLVVAHRLSTIRDADNIVVLENGRLVEQGTHEDLIARQGRYWHYVRLQDLGVEKQSVDVL